MNSNIKYSDLILLVSNLKVGYMIYTKLTTHHTICDMNVVTYQTMVLPFKTFLLLFCEFKNLSISLVYD